jgi:hypothetical protein
MSKNSRSAHGGLFGLYLVFGSLVLVVGLGVFLYTGEDLGSAGNQTKTQHTTVPAPALAGDVTSTITTEKTKH